MAHSDSEIESTNYQKTFVSVSHLSQVKIVYTSYNIYISMYLYIHIFTCLDIYIFIYLYIHIKKHVFLARDDFLTILPWSCSETNSEGFGTNLSHYEFVVKKYLDQFHGILSKGLFEILLGP